MFYFRSLALLLTDYGLNRKSQITVEFCYRFKEEHPEGWMLWVHASTITRFDEAYKDDEEMRGARAHSPGPICSLSNEPLFAGTKIGLINRLIWNPSTLQALR